MTTSIAGELLAWGIVGLGLANYWWGFKVYRRPDNTLEQELLSGWSKVLGPIVAFLAAIVAIVIRSVR